MLDDGLVTRAPVPIGVRSTIVPAARSAGRYPLDLSRARATTSCSHSSSASRLAVTGIKASPRLLSPRGFTVTLNDHVIDVGPFVRHGNLWTYSGRTDGGVRVRCRYRADGRLDLILSGAVLKGQLDQLVGQNLTMKVTRGKLSAQGNLIAQVKDLSVSGVASGQR